MLRRPATAINLTPADVERYEANQQQKSYEHQIEASSTTVDSSNKVTEQGNAKDTQRDRIMGGNSGGQGR